MLAWTTVRLSRSLVSGRLNVNEPSKYFFPGAEDDQLQMVLHAPLSRLDLAIQPDRSANEERKAG